MEQTKKLPVHKRDHVKVEHPFRISQLENAVRNTRSALCGLCVTNISTVSRKWNIRPMELAALFVMRTQDCRSIHFLPGSDVLIMTDWSCYGDVRMYNPDAQDGNYVVTLEMYDAYQALRRICNY